MAVAHRPHGRRRGPCGRPRVFCAASTRARTPTSTMSLGLRPCSTGALDEIRSGSLARFTRAAQGFARQARRAAGAPRIRDAGFDARARRVGGAARRRARGGVRAAARPARRQAGQHGRVAGLHGPRARHSGVQPLRRRAPADGRDDEHVRRAARRSARRRLPYLHLYYDAALRARGSRAARQGGLGSRPPESRSAGPSRVCGCAAAGRASSARARCRCGTA